VRHSVLATARPPFQGISDPSWIRRVEQLTDAGGTVRCIYHSDILRDPDLLTAARHFAAAGEDARVTHSVPTRMILTDGRSALMPVPHAQENFAGTAVLLIEHPQVVAGLERSFESLWEQATPLCEVVEGMPARVRARARGGDGTG
jgi:hypothetical protein